MDPINNKAFPSSGYSGGTGFMTNGGAAPMYGSSGPRPLPWMPGNTGTSMYPGAPRPMPWSGGQQTSSPPWGSQGGYGAAKPRGIAYMPGYGGQGPGFGQVGTMPQPYPAYNPPGQSVNQLNNLTQPYTPGGMTGASIYGPTGSSTPGMGIGGGATGSPGVTGGPMGPNVMTPTNGGGMMSGGGPAMPQNFANPVGNNTTGNGGLGNIQQGVGQVAHDLGQFNNYGQLDASGTRMWAGSGAGGGQGAWQAYNPNDPNQSAIHNMFQRYGSGWYSGNPTAQGHYDDMAPQFQALTGRQGTPQELNDLYMGVVPGQQQAAHNAFAAQSGAYNPQSSSYDPNAVRNLTSLNLLARQ